MSSSARSMADTPPPDAAPPDSPPEDSLLEDRLLEDARPRDITLRMEHASIAYGDVPVLEEIHGIVHPGEAVALIGPNGAGKSALIKAILGLVPIVRGRIE